MQDHPTDQQFTRFIRLPTVCVIAGVSGPTIWRWAQNGEFPKPVKLSPNVSAWDEAEVRAWLATKKAARG